MTAPDQTNAEVSDERLRELLPCPFCGKELEFSENLSIHGGGWMHHGDEAERDKPCFLIGKIVYNTPGDLERWNRRSVTSQASEGEVVAWEWWSAGRPDIKRVQHSKPGLVPNRQMRPLYASPSKRVERLETALKPFADCVFNDNGDMTISGTAKPKDFIRAYFAIHRPLQGGRS